MFDFAFSPLHSIPRKLPAQLHSQLGRSNAPPFAQYKLHAENNDNNSNVYTIEKNTHFSKRRNMDGHFE